MYKEKHMDTANTFKRMRRKRGFTQASLSQASGVGIRSIQFIDQNGINGTRCDIALTLAKTLRCMIEDLMDEETPE